MNYSPKLKTAMAEIEAVIKKHDLAAMITLHTPGYAELMNFISPSYSCAFKVPNGIRVRTRIKEDYDGDVKKRNKAIEDTINMFDLFATTLGPSLILVMDLLDKLKATTGFESEDRGFTPKSETDN